MKKYKTKTTSISTVHEPAVAYKTMHTSFNNIVKVDNNDKHKYLELVEEGLSVLVLKDFMDIADVHIDEMADILHLNSRTLRRIKEDSKLNSHISEKLVELIRLYKLGHEVFGDVTVFNTWMRRQIKGIGNRIPMDIVDTSIGIDIIKDTLERINHGIYA